MASTPQRFGRYELLSVLGGGGFATVYRAYDPALAREVALKALLPHLAADEAIRQRFLAEARAIAGLRHPNIVTVYDVGEADGLPFFAMELIDGQSLAAALAAYGAFGPARAVAILHSLCGAVDALHRAGLVHRDIKPANVMIEAGGRVALMDFGIARSQQGGSSLTQVGVSIGTPRYMAPEQVRGEAVGAAADVYALGVVAYELIAGKPPFTGDTAHVLHAQVYEPPPPLRALRPGLPEPLYQAIDAALAKTAAARPDSAGAFAALLDAALQAETPPTELHTAFRPAPEIEATLIDRPGGATALRAAPTSQAMPAIPTVLTPATFAQTTEASTALPALAAATPPAAPASPSRPARRKRTLLAALFGGLAALAVGGGAVFGALRLHDRNSGGNPPPAASAVAATQDATGGAAVVSDLLVYDRVKGRAQNFTAGPAVVVCFALKPGADRTPITIVVTTRAEPPSGAADPAVVGRSVSLPVSDATDQCYNVSALDGRAYAPGRYHVWLFQGARLLASGGFFALEGRGTIAAGSATPPPTPTVTATPAPLTPTRTPSPSPTPTRPPALPAVDLSQPPDNRAGRPALKITAVTPSGPAVVGNTFEFRVTAQNVGAAGNQGSISVSSREATGLTAALGPCEINARANVFAPNAQVSTLGGGTRASVGKAASRQWLAEADPQTAWPTNAQCTLIVRATVPASGNLTFLLRAATFAADDSIAFWPYADGPNIAADQQGFRAVVWTVPIQQP